MKLHARNVAALVLGDKPDVIFFDETMPGFGFRLRRSHDGKRIMREGDPADAFYVVRHGQVALETVVPARGAVVLQTVHDGELLGCAEGLGPSRPRSSRTA